ncbi:MAG: IS1595 family transposase [Phycisphaerales bacterium]|nr:IS1595 family transposase [Phycisphaerales bacterium]
MAQTYEINLVDLCEKFRSEDCCRAYLEKLRWPEGVECPRCGCKTVSRIHDRDQFDCDSCRYQFSVTAGTIMQDTKLPLWKWFLAVYMIVESKKGISANQLKRTLGVTYKTAWYLCHRIRKALEGQHSYLDGVIEMDSTFIGGRSPGKQGNKDNKAMITGAVERGGDVRISVQGEGGGESVKRLRSFIEAHIAEGAMLYTDEAPAYKSATGNRSRETVEHKLNKWVRGDVNTNGIEGVWSLFKRSVIGSYHKVSIKHLQAYLDEFEFRFNNRDNAFIFRDAMKHLVSAENVEYKDLVA